MADTVPLRCPAMIRKGTPDLVLFRLSLLVHSSAVFHNRSVSCEALHGASALSFGSSADSPARDSPRDVLAVWERSDAADRAGPSGVLERAQERWRVGRARPAHPAHVPDVDRVLPPAGDDLPPVRGPTRLGTDRQSLSSMVLVR